MRVVGIDEVGRGSWAGPLVAAAVLLTRPVTGLKDSKLLTALQRERLAAEIRRSGSIGLGWVQPAEIDQFGLTQAICRAMDEALQSIVMPYDKIVIDGSYNFLRGNAKASCLIKADQTIAAVSAASIVAKVARDTYMHKQAIKFPGYGFERHVGYGTAQHRQALQQIGLCELHRLSYKPVQSLAV